MEEYIARTNIMKEFQDRFDWLSSNAEKHVMGGVVYDEELQTAAIIAKEFLDRLKREPTVDVKPSEPVIHAYWYEFSVDHTHFCSECEHNAPYDKAGNELLPPWCSYCGAKMDAKVPEVNERSKE